MAPPSVEWALVLSGGHLREKVVIPTVSIGGRHFTAVFKESPALCQFLSGQRPKLHPLKESVVFSDLSRLRNAASTVDAEAGPDGGDALDDIGLDLAPESRRRRPKYYRSKQKRIVDIKVEDSSMAVLSGKGQASVYMEVTTENMTLLHRLVSTSLQALAQEDESVEEAPAPHTPSRHDDLGLGLVEHTPEKHSQGEQEVSTEAGCSDRGGGRSSRQQADTSFGVLNASRGWSSTRTSAAGLTKSTSGPWCRVMSMRIRPSRMLEISH